LIPRIDLFGSSFVVPIARTPLRFARVSISTLSARATPRPRCSRAVGRALPSAHFRAIDLANNVPLILLTL